MEEAGWGPRSMYLLPPFRADPDLGARAFLTAHPGSYLTVLQCFWIQVFFTGPKLRPCWVSGVLCFHPWTWPPLAVQISYALLLLLVQLTCLFDPILGLGLQPDYPSWNTKHQTRALWTLHFLAKSILSATSQELLFCSKCSSFSLLSLFSSCVHVPIFLLLFFSVLPLIQGSVSMYSRKQPSLLTFMAYEHCCLLGRQGLSVSTGQYMKLSIHQSALSRSNLELVPSSRNFH